MEYICSNCGCEFDEPCVINTTYESYFGAPLSSHTYLRLELCPCCGDDDFYEKEEETEEIEDE